MLRHTHKKRSFLLHIAAGYRSVRYNTDLPPPSLQSCSSVRDRGTSQAQDPGQAFTSISSTFATGFVAFTWAPQMLPQMLFRELCLVLLQLAPERGRLPAASDKHSPWGEALKHHAVAEIRERYI